MQITNRDLRILHTLLPPLHEAYGFSTTIRRKLLGDDCAQGVIQSNLGPNASNGVAISVISLWSVLCQILRAEHL